MKSKLAIFAAAAMLLASCNSDLRISPGQAYYRTFSYTGNDPIFNKSRLSDGEIFNPILQGAYSDASICRKGNDYYMVTANYTFYPGIPVLHSTDLVNWEQVSYAMPTDKHMVNTSLKAEQGIYPPSIRYSEAEDMFYITSTLVGGGGHFVISAKDPSGPWSLPEWLYGLGGVHPCLFFDTDGKSYIINQGNPDYDPPYTDYKVIWLQEFDIKTLKTKGERRIIFAGGDILEKKPSWLEAPHLFKTRGHYYLIASEGGSLGNGFATCVYRADNIWGPYERYEQNPILTQRRLSPGREQAVTNTGHMDMVQAHDGEWWAVFQGVRPYSDNNDYNQGRETYLYHVSWDNDWPYIIRNGEGLMSKLKSPFGAAYKESEPFQKYIPHGNFTYVEHFESDTLPMQWAFLRNPIQENPIVPDGGEGLVLPLSNNNLRSQRNTGFIAFRVMHQEFCAETEMHFMPHYETEFSGLALYLNDQNNIQFGISLREDTPVLTVEKAAKENDETIKEEIKTKFLKEGFNGKIFLRIDCLHDGYAFKYKMNAEEEYETLVSQVALKTLSLRTFNCFYGVTIGPYASQEDK